MPNFITKRDGTTAAFNPNKISAAIQKAFAATDCILDPIEMEKNIRYITTSVVKKISEASGIPTVDDVQNAVEDCLMSYGYKRAAKAYILYRSKRDTVRDSGNNLNKQLREIFDTSAQDSDLKRDNANVDGNSSMGTMLQVGAVVSKDYYAKHYLKQNYAEANKNGDIHIHDFDFYGLTLTCCQIDLLELFKNGFSTGHGYLREPNSIQSYASLACIAIQSNQNDQHGGQSIPNFDYSMAPGVAKTYIKEFYNWLVAGYEDVFGLDSQQNFIKECTDEVELSVGQKPSLDNSNVYDRCLIQTITSKAATISYILLFDVVRNARRRAEKSTERATHQAMEAFIHNLNTMHSRAGAQTPFSSINYGTDTSIEGRMVMRNLLLATEEGLGNGETPIFPIQIFKVKDGVNFNSTDINYDLFKQACKVSAKRLFPNFSFIDSPFNLQYYKPGHPETEVAYMGCRTRVLGNEYDKTKEISHGRGNLSFTSINLPRLAIEANGDEEKFFIGLKQMLDLTSEQLLDRLEIQSRRKVYNFPFLMGQGVWLDSNTLGPNDEVREVIKHGTLSIGFIGLAETLTALYGHHHGESDEMEEKGLQIIRFMRAYTDEKAKETKLNFSLLATPAEGLSGYFVKKDKIKYGVIKGVTDKEYYTNSFHIPVSYPISAFDKIKKEAPFHALTNAGHISYVELDGDVTANTEAFEAVIRCMHDANMGYGSINHPVDRDPICGYVGIIGDICPRCGREANQPITIAKYKKLAGKYSMPEIGKSTKKLMEDIII